MNLKNKKMNKIKLIALSLLVSGFVSAQNNVIKTGLPNILYGEYQLGYERMINSSQSMQLKAGYFQPVSSFLIDKDLFRFTDQYSIKGVDGGFQTSLEYRFYMGENQGPKGLYLAPYARLAQLYMGYTDVIDNLEFDVSTRFTLAGVGAQVGYQWLINDRFCIDFNFFGAGIDFWVPRITYSREGYSSYQNIEPDIREALEVSDDVKKFFNPSKRLATKVNPDNLVARIPFVLPGFRIGLSVGYAFGK